MDLKEKTKTAGHGTPAQQRAWEILEYDRYKSLKKQQEKESNLTQNPDFDADMAAAIKRSLDDQWERLRADR